MKNRDLNCVFQDMYGGNETLKARGALSIGVPGEIAGLYEAWRHHGKLPWKSLVTPAAKLALAFRAVQPPVNKPNI